MGLTVKNENEFVLGDEITNILSFPNEIATKEIGNYENLKPFIYDMDMDNEEKADLLNKISRLNTMISLTEKNKIKKELDQFKEENNI